MSQEPTEGVIRYQMHWDKGPAPLLGEIAGLLQVRQKLFALRLIGWDEHEHVGYGNISCRHSDGHTFYISGTQTSGIEEGTPELFTRVTASDPASNQLSCTGPVAASSEAMTHGMLYGMDQGIGAVIHVHNAALWESLSGRVPTTREEAGYGTPEMAAEIAALFSTASLGTRRILVMAGHKDGLITFGATPVAALEVLLSWYDQE